MNDRDGGLTLDVLAKMPFGVSAMRLILNDGELFADKEYFQRKEILSRVVGEWERVSGERLDRASVAGPFKKCMQRTPGSVPFKALGSGKYRRGPVRTDLTAPPAQPIPRQERPRRDVKPPPRPNSPLPSPSKEGSVIAPESVRKQWLDDGPAERNLGDGSFRVYAWCHKNDAKDDDARWPIKVGHAGKGGLRSRLDRSQMKEFPRYLLCIRLQSEADAKSLERALHTCLKFRGRRYRESPGTEWFRTSPQELVELVQVINPNLQEWDSPPVPSW